MLTFADRALAQCAAHGSAPSGELQKAIGEGRAGAIFALSLGKVLGVETWMRLVHPREGAPDVRVMYLESSGPRGSNRMMTLQVEVATFTLHSSEELSEFIFNKKLDPTKKAYASNTAILIYVQRGCTPQDIQGRARVPCRQRGAPVLLSGGHVARPPMAGRAGGTKPPWPSHRRPGRGS